MSLPLSPRSNAVRSAGSFAGSHDAALEKRGEMKIRQYDLRLYGLLRRCLRGNYVSGLRDALTPEMRRGMLTSLRTTEIGKQCDCGEAFCRSFSTLAGSSSCGELFTVRFNVDGELHVTCDAQGTIHHVQWLRDDVRERDSVHRYWATSHGWLELPLP